MLSIFTIATKNNALQDIFEINVPEDYIPQYQGKIYNLFPIIIFEKDQYKMVMARWGLDDLKYDVKGQTNFPLGQSLKNKPHNIYVRNFRCAIPANCFISEQTKTPYVIKLVKDRLFCLGGYYRYNIFSGQYNFGVFNTGTSGILKKYMGDSMPVLFETDQYKRWLKSDHLSTIMEMGDRSPKKYFDLFPVSSEVLRSHVNDKNLLKPVGKSLMEMGKNKNLIKKKIDLLNHDRANRGK